MRHHQLVMFFVVVFTAFGIFSITRMNKDEFPQFTIRQAVVAAVYPGATSEEVEKQVTRPLEQFLFSYEEINSARTYSITEDGMTYIFAELHVTVKRKDEAWAKIRAGLQLFQKTSLPPGVLQIAVIDDFGNTSSILLALESENHSMSELKEYADIVQEHLRTIPAMGKIKISGIQQDEIAVEVDVQQLSRYGINESVIQGLLATQGLRTLTGSAGKNAGNMLLHVEAPYSTEYEIGQQIVYTDPLDGSVVRLADIARITRRPAQGSHVNYYTAEDKASAIILSLEMLPKHNIVAFGETVEETINRTLVELPADVRLHHITDQPHVVRKSVTSFLRDILVSVLVVILVMLVLFPLRTALVASTGVPVCIAVCIGMMYAFGIELNTVTLAALIVVLGMIVDDSVIIIDGYTNLLEQRHSRWYSASVSTRQLFIPMSLATCSISSMFFPMTHIITGPLGEFVQLFPYAILIALTASIFYASWVTPYLATRHIGRRDQAGTNAFERLQNRFFDHLQEGYEWLLIRVFRAPWLSLGVAVLFICLGGFLFTRLNVQMMPKAEREAFAVEMHLRSGSSIADTEAIADSLARVMRTDPRVKSITSFVGMSSPRFHATYAPQMPHPNYAQFIVNTVSTDATEQLLREYAPRYENAFPGAFIRFKQMDYQAVRNPIEVILQGADLEQLEEQADRLKAQMASMPQLSWVHSDYEESLPVMSIRLVADEAERLGITQAMLSLYLNRVFEGHKLGSVWEGDMALPIVLYARDADSLRYTDIGDLPVPTCYPGVTVPLRQVASLEPAWHHPRIVHHNGIWGITVAADMIGNSSSAMAKKQISRWIRRNMPEANVQFAGLDEANHQIIPQIMWSLLAALLVMFIVLLIHFGKLSLSVLTLCTSVLCIFGTFAGLYIFGLDVSITAVLGAVSLIGIIVRNAIIMYEYAEALRTQQHLSGREAAYQAGLRRMRPIFLTSATTALGVIPMILAGTGLWMPMGVVICFGTIFTLPLVVTILPIAYWKLYAR